MKLSLITAGLVVVTSALTIVQARSLISFFSVQPVSATVSSMVTPANAATNTLAPSQAELAAGAASLPALLPVPAQIGGQKITQDAQAGISCLISKNNDKDVCGEMALKREIAKCVAGIGVEGGCFDFLARSAVASQAKAPRHHEARRSRTGSYDYRRAGSELRRLTHNWF
jgi:hypothetical protein